jgi:hypothetical protein
MSGESQAQIQTFGAALIGFVGVVGLGGFLILHHGGAAVKAPVVTYAAVDAASALPLRTRSGVAARSEDSAIGEASASSPAPLLSENEIGDASAPADPAAAAAPTVFAAAKLIVTRHLGFGSSSSSVSDFAGGQSAKDAAAKQKYFSAPKLDLSRNMGTIASTVHYGVRSRAQLMGRAAGPIYNFSGGGSNGQAAAGPSSSDVVRQVEEARTQVGASSMADNDKSKVDQNLIEVRRTAESSDVR